MLVRKNETRRGERILTVLDIGSTKIVCLIVALRHEQRHQPGAELPARLLGYGHVRSRGVKAGVIVNIELAEQAIRSAVGAAEKMAGLTVRDVIVSVSCGRIASSICSARATVRGEAVADGDIARVLSAGRAYAERDGRTLLQLHRLGYTLDDHAGIEEPRGMTARELGIDLHAVTADEPPLRNLVTLLRRCMLSVEGLVTTGFASALGTIDVEEARLGATVIDLGGGTTTFAVFSGGNFLHTGAIAVGGNHLTFDIARSLSTPVDEAERIKTYYGALTNAGSDEREPVPYSGVGDEPAGQLFRTTRSEITRIIMPRIEQILMLVAERLAHSGVADLAGGRVVLTGGGAQLTGIREHAARYLGKSVRVAPARAPADAPERLNGPGFSVATGLAHAVLMPGAAVRAYEERSALRSGAGYLERMGEWFMQSFWDDENVD